jgi:glycosyltransferase involved in cell wall biosynthesis
MAPQPQPRDEQAPDVAVVVATRNRAQRLGRLLEGLRGQTHRAFEVVVVDDGSGDETPTLLSEAAGEGFLALRQVRREQPGGPSLTRNEGWRAAGAALVAFIDDDCVPEPGWLAALVAAAHDHPGAVVQGPIEPDPAEARRRGPFSRTLEVTELGPYFQAANVAYPRELLERMDGFDAQAFPFVGEDADLAWRAFAAGARVVWAPDARVRHAVNRLGPVGKLRVAARWGDSVALVARHPELRARQLTHGIFWKGTHYLLARALIGLALRRRAPLLALWLGAPYVRNLLERGELEGGGPPAAPWYVLEDLVEAAAVVRGAVRSRILVI